VATENSDKSKYIYLHIKKLFKIIF